MNLPQLPQDKANHFIYGLLIAAVCGSITEPPIGLAFCIWMGLLILGYMAVSGKSIEELIDETYAQIGAFAVERYDLHIEEAQKQAIIKNCQENAYHSFGSYIVERIENMDGFKFHLGNEEWVMIRPSGTEPVLRVYAESKDSESAYKILDACKAAIL
jgi:phosphomannomutase